jgi:hypothetical protein
MSALPKALFPAALATITPATSTFPLLIPMILVILLLLLQRLWGL